jgi:RNA polymerase sigma factor (sigma-70 family)
MTLEPDDLERELQAAHDSGFGWALVCCRWDRQEAEDVLQAAYEKFLDGSARFDGRATFRTWLFAVIRRTAQERRRRLFLRTLVLRRWWTLRADPPASATPVEAASDREELSAVREALVSLSRRQREIVSLVFYDELTVDDAARVMGVSVGSARTHYHRAKARLRRALGGGSAS